MTDWLNEMENKTAPSNSSGTDWTKELTGEQGLPTAAPAPPQDYSRLIPQAASALVKGAGATLGAIGNLNTSAMQGVENLTNAGLNLLRDKPQAPAQVQAAPLMTSQSIQGATQAAGLTDRPELAPQNTLEKYVTAGAEGVGGALPMVALTGPAGLLQSITSGAGSGVGGQAGRDMFPQHPVLAGIAGAIVGAISGGIIGTGIEKGIGLAQGAKGEVGQAYDRAGVPMELTGDSSGNTTLQQLQAAGSKLPGGGRINEAAKRGIASFGTSAENTANYLGTASSPEDVGSAFQGSAEQWVNNFKQAASDAEEPVNRLIPKQAPLAPSATQQVIDDLGNKMPGMPATAEVMKSDAVKALRQSLSEDLGDNGTVPFASFRYLRGLIGDKLSKKWAFGDEKAAASYDDYKRLYGAMTEDMKATAQAQGPEALDAFTKAQQLEAQGYDFNRRYILPFTREGTPPEALGKSLMSAADRGGTNLEKLASDPYGVMQDAVDQLASAKIRDMARALPGNQMGAEGVTASPQRFLSQWSKLSSEAKDVLFRDPEIRSKLEALGTVAGRMRETAGFIPRSNTPLGVAVGTMPFSAYAGASKGAALGAPFGPLGTVGGAAVGGLGGAITPFAPGWLAGMATVNKPLARFLDVPRYLSPAQAQAIQAGAVAPSLLNYKAKRP